MDSRLLQELKSLGGSERSSHRSSSSIEKKRLDQLLQIAIHDLESASDEPLELPAVLGLMDGTISSDPKSD